MEFEVKLAVDAPETMEQILTDPEIAAAMAEPVREIPMETTYYDAPDGSLSARMWTLRRRMEGGSPVVTLKAPSGIPGCRNEWETPCGDVLAAVPALIAQGAPESLRDVNAVRPICGAAFQRRAVLLRLENCTAELALDLGRLFREDREAPIQEVELELKSGNPAAMLGLGERLCRDYGLHPEPKSKFYRASRL